jgi:hypothetical protein
MPVSIRMDVSVGLDAKRGDVNAYRFGRTGRPIWILICSLDFQMRRCEKRKENEKAEGGREREREGDQNEKENGKEGMITGTGEWGESLPCCHARNVVNATVTRKAHRQ